MGGKGSGRPSSGNWTTKVSALMASGERAKRLAAFADKLEESREEYNQKEKEEVKDGRKV